jgi:hypothetical protein
LFANGSASPASDSENEDEEDIISGPGIDEAIHSSPTLTLSEQYDVNTDASQTPEPSDLVLKELEAFESDQAIDSSPVPEEVPLTSYSRLPGGARQQKSPTQCRKV